jgi:cell division protein FtsW
LTLYSLLAIYAASALKGVELYQEPQFFLKKQFFAVLSGYFLIFVLYKIPFTWISHLNLPLFIFSFVSLALVFVPGMYSKVGGALRWLSIGGLRIQPGEIVKISMVFFLSKNLSRKHADIHNVMTGLLPNFLILGIFSFFLLRQPDFGTTALLTLLTFLMLYTAGISRKFLILSCSIGFCVLIAAIYAAPYRLKRVLTFLDPWTNLQREGFQIVQSFLAFRNGGFWGVGLGSSKQKLFFLPEAHTDFILSVIAEESGFLGTAFVCLSFMILILCGAIITFTTKDRYQQFLAFGLTSLLSIQALFNIAVVMGMLPTKGITLPFLSSGLSSLLVFFFVVGVLARIGRESKRAHYDNIIILQEPSPISKS